MKRADHTGKKINKLTFIRYDHNNDKNVIYWLFKCDCGNKKVIAAASVINENTKSCGCLAKDQFLTKVKGKRWLNYTKQTKEELKENKRIRDEKYRLANKDKIKERNSKYQKIYYEANRDRARLRHKENILANNARCSKNAKRNIDNLSDAYIHRLLIRDGRLKQCDMPQELIELKRAQIKLKRGLENVKENK